MALTLAEAAKLSNDVVLQGVIETAVKESRVLQILPFIEMVGNALTYNRENAMALLEYRLQEMKRQQDEAAFGGARMAQIGTGERCEKIRTYNYKDNRVTDHRLNQNFSLEPVLEGDLETVIQSCISRDQQERLAALALESTGVA